MTFNVKYKLFLRGKVIKEGEYKITNQYSMKHAQQSLEQYLRDRLWNFDKIEFPSNIDLPPGWADIFGGAFR